MREHRVSGVRFSSLSDFLIRTAGEDREFLPEEDLGRFPVVCCGMANGAGGWILLGAAWGEDEPEVLGLDDPVGMERRLRALLAGERRISSDTVGSFSIVDEAGTSLMAVRVEPAEWHRRPVCVGGDYIRGVYRRVEGVDVASGLRARFRLALDALERLRSDGVVPGLTVADLHEESFASFREAVVARRPEWRALSEEAFLSRALVLSDGGITRAGHLLLGKKSTRVRALFRDASGNEDIFEVRNLWRAYADLLPRFCEGLSVACAAAFRECFVNALVHAEHDEGAVRLTGCGDRVRIENPGLSRAFPQGESLCRNVRLMHMFRLAGAAVGEGKGLAAVRAYQPGFELHQDPLELSTAAELRLERLPVPALARTPFPVVSLASCGGPSVEEALVREAESVPSVASASDFLVVPAVLEEDAPSGDGASGEVMPDTPVPQGGVPPRPEELAPPAGRAFVFGSAAQELELAVAEIRRQWMEAFSPGSAKSGTEGGGAP